MVCDRVLMVQWIVCSLQILSLHVIYVYELTWMHTRAHHLEAHSTQLSKKELKKKEERIALLITEEEWKERENTIEYGFGQRIFLYVKRENEWVSFEGQ